MGDQHYAATGDPLLGSYEGAHFRALPLSLALPFDVTETIQTLCRMLG